MNYLSQAKKRGFTEISDGVYLSTAEYMKMEQEGDQEYFKEFAKPYNFDSHKFYLTTDSGIVQPINNDQELNNILKDINK